jgi:hypothetical protein
LVHHQKLELLVLVLVLVLLGREREPAREAALEQLVVVLQQQEQLMQT